MFSFFDSFNYWLNRKNCCVPEIGLVTVFCPLTTTGAGELVVQTDDARLVVDCRLKPVELVGHIKKNCCPEGRIVSCGGGGDRLNTVPLPELPPYCVVPYRVFFV